jgi:[ribosomal protein S5]-alanine N-acetyltransferase
MPHRLPDQIETDRLRLRQPDLADPAAIFQAYTQDLEVCRFMVWTPHASESATREFIESCIKDWTAGSRLAYVIVEQGANTAIGMIEARMLGTTVEIGYVLARPHWGKGLMPEAITALAAAVLENPGSYRVQAVCDVDNIGSQRALEKSGFTREGKLERYSIHPNLSPEPRASFMYARVR